MCIELGLRSSLPIGVMPDIVDIPMADKVMTDVDIVMTEVGDSAARALAEGGEEGV